MNVISGAYSISPFNAGKRIPDASGFSVPKSSLRRDGTEGREAGEASAVDSVELSGMSASSSQVFSYPGDSSTLQAQYSGKIPGTAGKPSSETEDGDEDSGENAAEAGEPASGEPTDARGEPLDENERRELEELKARDREVRQHEQAHKAVGGQYAGAVSYEYQQGADGKRYAVGGEVSIDVSSEKDPEATMKKMRQVKAAALAPANPSSQDLSVAAEASKKEAEAKQEAGKERMEEASSPGGDVEKAAADDAPPEEESRNRADGEPVAGESSRRGEHARDGYADFSSATRKRDIPAADIGASYARLAAGMFPSAAASVASAFSGRSLDRYA